MVEKKATSKKTAEVKEPVVKKTAAPKKSPAKSVEIVINPETVGFRAGDVYQALATAGKPLSLAEIVKGANISKDAALLGMGWLFKEGKITDEGEKISLA